MFGLLANPSAALKVIKTLALLPVLFPLIVEAEKLFWTRSANGKRGKEKKQFVLQALDVLTNELTKRGFITEEINQGLDKLAAELIDVLVAVLNVKNGLARDANARQPA